MIELELNKDELAALQAAIVGYSLELARVFPNNSAAADCIKTLDGILDQIDQISGDEDNENTYDL